MKRPVISEKAKERYKNPENHPNYKDGRSLKQYFCKCGKKICWITFVKGSKKCGSCAWKGKLKGKNNPHYIDGRTPFSKALRTTSDYEIWRGQVFKRDKYACVNCNFKGYLEADHIKPFSVIIDEFLKQYDQFSPIEDKETLLRLATKYSAFWDLENGRTLCEECHKQTDTYKSKSLNFKR